MADQIIDETFEKEGRMAASLRAPAPVPPTDAEMRRMILEHVMRVIKNYFEEEINAPLVLNLSGLPGGWMARIQTHLESRGFSVSLEGSIMTANP